jgi:hypothetical protein
MLKIFVTTKIERMGNTPNVDLAAAMGLKVGARAIRQES